MKAGIGRKKFLMIKTDTEVKEKMRKQEVRKVSENMYEKILMKFFLPNKSDSTQFFFVVISLLAYL